MFDILYFNFFTIGGLIPTIFTLLTTMYLFFLIKKPSLSTIVLGFFFLTMFIFNGGYLITAAFYDTIGAFHRWFTAGIILVVETFMTYFFFVYPYKKAEKISRILFISMMTIALVVGVYFIYVTWNADKYYRFDGHYWDFDADKISTIVGIFIMAYVVIFLVAGIWRVVVCTKSGKRTAVLLILLGFASASIAPSIFNTLSREGMMSREWYQMSWDLLVVIALFIVVITYINNTDDKSTFMVKIIGVSVVTFLLMMQVFNFVVSQDTDNTYDQVHREMLTRVIRLDLYPEDLRYLHALDVEKNEYQKKDIGKIDPNLSMETVKREMVNSFYYEKIRLAEKKDLNNSIREILKNSPPSFDGYKKSIEMFMGTEEFKNGGKTAMLEYLDGLYRPVLYRYNKILKIQDENFKERVLKYLDSFPESMKGFAVIGRTYLRLPDAPKDGAELKNNLLTYMGPLKSAGTRHYRKSLEKNEEQRHYIGYMFVDNGTIYEAGFDYKAYRIYFHSSSFKIIIILLSTIVLVLVGFQFFFRGVLIQPLNRLLSGVEQVNQNDYSVHIPVTVQDEFGILSKNFNYMVKSVNEARTKLQEYAETLEEKVKERTNELQNTLETVQKLKVQQDGDYFLTSLLLEPLSSNYVRSKYVHVNFFLRQKKQFSFRQWEKEIGGDLCTAHTIYLRGKSFTVFMNADAMGKSMQGAGGILVLGSVFQTIIERTHTVPSEKENYPEHWLKNSFVELHKVFETFEGSMLISLVLGLVDDETGLLYFINAEHPFTILYRNGKAKFIEDELEFRKLGTTGMKGTLYVQTFQLHPKDVVVVGSDGKDDIVMTDVNGKETINEDETHILRCIESAKGDLEGIFENVLKKGRLMDDYSMIRIAYKEASTDFKEEEINKKVMEYIYTARTLVKQNQIDKAIHKLGRAYRLERKESEVLKELIRAYIKKNNFKKAARYAEDFNFLRPAESEYLYIASYCHKMAGDAEKAAKIGERLRIREPRMLKNLINLADVYIVKRNFERAKLMIDTAMEIDRENEKLMKLVKIMKKAEKEDIAL